MTVATQVKQTLASLKGVQSTLQTLAAIEENSEAKDILSRNVRRINEVIRDMEKRVGVLEYEEPQYKGF
ncbi:MAG: DUF1657 domain-containing protein [Bacillota bacterium]